MVPDQVSQLFACVCFVFCSSPVSVVIYHCLTIQMCIPVWSYVSLMVMHYPGLWLPVCTVTYIFNSDYSIYLIIITIAQYLACVCSGYVDL